jgi:hypothetical protein
MLMVIVVVVVAVGVARNPLGGALVARGDYVAVIVVDWRGRSALGRLGTAARFVASLASFVSFASSPAAPATSATAARPVALGSGRFAQAGRRGVLVLESLVQRDQLGVDDVVVILFAGCLGNGLALGGRVGSSATSATSAAAAAAAATAGA